VLIDRRGIVRVVHRGLDSAEQLERELSRRIESLLN